MRRANAGTAASRMIRSIRERGPASAGVSRYEEMTKLPIEQRTRSGDVQSGHRQQVLRRCHRSQGRGCCAEWLFHRSGDRPPEKDRATCPVELTKQTREAADDDGTDAFRTDASAVDLLRYGKGVIKVGSREELDPTTTRGSTRPTATTDRRRHKAPSWDGCRRTRGTSRRRGRRSPPSPPAPARRNRSRARDRRRGRCGCVCRC
jgi:hypothetical protein